MACEVRRDRRPPAAPWDAGLRRARLDHARLERRGPPRGPRWRRSSRHVLDRRPGNGGERGRGREQEQQQRCQEQLAHRANRPQVSGSAGAGNAGAPRAWRGEREPTDGEAPAGRRLDLFEATPNKCSECDRAITLLGAGPAVPRRAREYSAARMRAALQAMEVGRRGLSATMRPRAACEAIERISGRRRAAWRARACCT